AVPEVGAALETENSRVEVVEMEGQRVRKVLIARRRPATDQGISLQQMNGSSPQVRRRYSAYRSPNSDSSRASSEFIRATNGGSRKSATRTPIALRKTSTQPKRPSSRPR